MTNRICPVCNKEFTSNKYFHTFCSHECRMIGRDETLHKMRKYNCTCKACGKKFLGLKEDASFCSTTCMGKAARKASYEDIKKYVEEHPNYTLREIADVFGISRESVRLILHKHKMNSRAGLSKRQDIAEEAAKTINTEYNKILDDIISKNIRLEKIEDFNPYVRDLFLSYPNVSKSTSGEETRIRNIHNNIITKDNKKKLLDYVRKCIGYGDLSHKIQDCLANTNMSYNEIAEKLNCSTSLVSNINLRKGIRPVRKRKSRKKVS